MNLQVFNEQTQTWHKLIIYDDSKSPRRIIGWIDKPRRMKSDSLIRIGDDK